jgi:isochorismate hydrolase
MYRPDLLESDRAMLLVIDVQEKLLPLIDKQREVLRAARKLIRGAKVFELPILATEQYPKGIGRTHEGIRDCLRECSAKTMEKACFSAWAEASVREAMLAIDRPQVIVTGIETHVCVQQSALDLKSRDFEVFVCADAVGSRGKLDHKAALHRMRHAGVIVTTVESVLFELCSRCDAPRFKPMLELIKQAGDDHE